MTIFLFFGHWNDWTLKWTTLKWTCPLWVTLVFQHCPKLGFRPRQEWQGVTFVFEHYPKPQLGLRPRQEWLGVTLVFQHCPKLGLRPREQWPLPFWKWYLIWLSAFNTSWVMVLSKSSTFKYLFQYLKFIESFYKPFLYGPRAILGGSALGHFYVTEIFWPLPRVQILARQILVTVLCRKKFWIYVEGTTRRHFREGRLSS